MYITVELLRDKRACTEGCIWFLRHFPQGAELDDLIKSKEAQECSRDFVWWFYDNVCSDKRLLALCGVNKSDGVNGSHGVNKSDGVSWSHGVNKSDGVNGSNGVNRSNGVSWSDGMNRSDGVNWSNGVNRSDGVILSDGVNWSFGCYSCHGIDSCLFCYEATGRYLVFNKPVSAERVSEIRRTLYSLLGSWRPVYNNIKALYLAHGSDWKLIPVHNAVELPIKDAWSGMPAEAIEYVVSLPEFDADIFKLITGMECGFASP